MRYYTLQYIIKILLLNGLFVLFSHAMDTEGSDAENSSLVLNYNDSYSLNEGHLLLAPLLPSLPNMDTEDSSLFLNPYDTYSLNEDPLNMGTEGSSLFLNFNDTYSLNEDPLNMGTEGSSLFLNFNDTYSLNEDPLNMDTEGSSLVLNPYDPEKSHNTTINTTINIVKRKRVVKQQTQKKKPKTRKLAKVGKIQKPYNFKCKYCTKYECNNICRHIIFSRAIKHLKDKHPNLCSDDAFITKCIKDCLKCPKNVVFYSVSCPNKDCEIKVHQMENPWLLTSKLHKHLVRCTNKVDLINLPSDILNITKENKKILYQAIKEYVDEKREYNLVPNPYSIEQYIYRSTKKKLVEAGEIQEPYNFKCKYCTETEYNRLYKHRILNLAVKHLKDEHPNLCSDDTSITKFIKDCVQYPKKVIEFSVSCPDCEEIFRIIDQPGLLIRKLYRHSEKENDISIRETIKNHINKTREYNLVPNPYSIEQYIYRSTKKKLVEVGKIQEPYNFKCKYCTEYEYNNIYRNRIFRQSIEHLKDKHPNLCFDDASITNCIKDCLKCPKKVIEFSVSCPNKDCEIKVCQFEDPLFLTYKLNKHLVRCTNKVDLINLPSDILNITKEDKEILRQTIKKYIDEKREYNLVPNPYSIEQYIYRITKNTMINTAKRKKVVRRQTQKKKSKIIKLVENNIKYPNKLTKFSISCPNKHCEKVFSVTDRPCYLNVILNKHFIHCISKADIIELDFDLPPDISNIMKENKKILRKTIKKNKKTLRQTIKENRKILRQTIKEYIDRRVTQNIESSD